MATMRTAGIKRLVDEVLKTLPKPHTEDVIDHVFQAIERRPDWRRAYDELCVELGKTVVNTWGGFWIAHSEGRWGESEARATSSLIESYSKLTKTGKRPGQKMKEPEALKAMSDYYQAHKAKLPKSVASRRELIVELLMEGYTAEEAFSRALSDRARGS